MSTNNLKLAHEVPFIVHSLKAANKRRVDYIGESLAEMAIKAKAEGESPRSFRARLRRGYVGNEWLREVQDRYPNLTDNNLDSAMRHACKLYFGANWLDGWIAQ